MPFDFQMPYHVRVTPAPTVVGPSSGVAYVGNPISVQFSALDGIGPFTWAGFTKLPDDTLVPLPLGLSVNPTTGLLSGTLAAPFEGDLKIVGTDTGV